jgi:glycosyltransferase involved in cell wall biosynthesis
VVDNPLRALLVDPSLFTAPYDAALARGLAAVAVESHWAVRRLRDHEEQEIDPANQTQLFYPVTEGRRRRNSAPWRLFKGLEHGFGLSRLTRMARGFDIVHFQWAMVPMMDAAAMRVIRRFRPVILTLHDTQPFNGKAMNRLRTSGTGSVLAAADHVIVHTHGGRDALILGGLGADRVTVVPHGPLGLPAQHSPTAQGGTRWTIMLFGRLQSYKGIDILIEAIGLMDAATRAKICVIVAGEPMIDIEPLKTRAAFLGLDDGIFHFETRHFAKGEMASLLAKADAFVLPYRAIEASGIFFLIAELGRWIIASDVGVFRDMMQSVPGAGDLVPAADPAALKAAIVKSIGRRPTASILSGATDWLEIGRRTRVIYEQARCRFIRDTE